MKLRIKDNSSRFRITLSELEELGTEGFVSCRFCIEGSLTPFPRTAKLLYKGVNSRNQSVKSSLFCARFLKQRFLRTTRWRCVMKRFLILCPLCLMVALCFVSLGLAKDWSPEQQAVVDRIEWCHDRWLDAYKKGNVDVYFDACTEKDSLVWFTSNGMPSTQDRARRAVPNAWSQMKNLYWEDFYPFEVRIHGDTAFVYSVSTWVAELSGGETDRVERRELWVYHKEGGIWRLIEGMVAPVN